MRWQNRRQAKAVDIRRLLQLLNAENIIVLHLYAGGERKIGMHAYKHMYK